MVDNSDKSVPPGEIGVGDVGFGGLRCEYGENPLGIDIVRPRLSWVINFNGRNWRQDAFQILVASSEGILGSGLGDLWDSGRIQSDQNVNVEYQGRALESQMRCFWKVRVWDTGGNVSGWSKTAWWEMALLSAGDWSGAWINDGRSNPEKDEDYYEDDPSPIFRKEFVVDKQIKHARLYVSGLGYYEAILNGKRVGENVLDPGWTSYEKRVLYSTYNVTENIVPGKNCIGAMLGNGWYNPLPMKMWGWVNLRKGPGLGRPRLIAELVLEYSDGKKQIISTDETWRVGKGPVIRNNIYLGEVYDARLEQVGWKEAGFDDSNWKFAVAADEHVGLLRSQYQPPIKVTKEIAAVKLTEPQPGVYIFDMGQNFAGWVRLSVTGPKGTKIKLRYGELLYPEGTLNVMTSVCGQIKPEANKVVKDAKPGYGGKGCPILAEQSDTYILKGEGAEIYVPRFTFHAFRYVEVTGLSERPTIQTLKGLRLNSAVKSVGSFSCSNEMFNQIWQMCNRTLLSNLFSVQSDCPGRERFGYGGDIVAAAEMAIFNFDMAGFYTKSVCDMAKTSKSNGSIASTAPQIAGFGCELGWSLAFPYALSLLYQYYGDKRQIREHYEAVKRLVEFCRTYAKDGIIEIMETGLSDHESIDLRPVALTSTAFYYHHVKLLSEFAGIIGKNSDAELYGSIAKKIRTAFIERFLKTGTGQFDIHTQACQAFAFYYDMVTENERHAAVEVLLNEILVHHEGHLSTGIFGTKYLLEVLTRTGHADVAYTIVDQKTFPGWGYMLENNATTLWEHWEFSDNVFSHNHPMFGSVGEWLFKAIAGIRPADDAIGFDKIIIEPQFVGGLSWAKGSYDSIRGQIISSWKVEGDKVYMDVSIPGNTQAKIYIPAAKAEDVFENDVLASTAEGVQFCGIDNDRAVFAVGSGRYRFISKLTTYTQMRL